MRSARLKTEDDLMALPNDDKRHELVKGVIVTEPLPTPIHDRVRRRLHDFLKRFVEEYQLGEVFGRAGYVLGRNPDTIRGPDLSFVRRERLAGVDFEKYFRGAPDLAVLILSTIDTAVRAKVGDYLKAGCRLVWVIETRKGLAIAYSEPSKPREVDILDGDGVLAGLRIPVDAIFER